MFYFAQTFNYKVDPLIPCLQFASSLFYETSQAVLVCFYALGQVFFNTTVLIVNFNDALCFTL